MIRVDLRSKVVSPSHSIFMVRPGSNYKLYDTFLEAQAIFADLAGLELENGRTLSEQENITAQLHRARTLRLLRRVDAAPPSRDLADYSDLKNDNSIRQLRLILQGFFDVAQKGDLVLVPPSTFSKHALVGELLSDPSDLTTALVKGERLYGRKVRWLAKLPKGKLSPYLLDLISKPNAFVRVRKEERPAILREAYGSYVIPGDDGAPTECRSRFDVDDPEFTTTDDLYIQAFFNFVAANSKRLRANNVDLLEIKSAAFEKLTGNDAFDLQSNINSPGFLNLISSGYGSLVASALFSLAITVGSPAVEAAVGGTILIGNSLDANDPCTAAVHEEVLQHLRLLGVEKWTQACEMASHAADSTGLNGQARVVIEEGQEVEDEQ